VSVLAAASPVVPRMWSWLGRGKQDENFGIEPGQRFRSVGTATILWEVATIAHYTSAVLPHVRLQRVGAPGDAKTVSLRVLRDERFYLPAG
jgi:hypothetical protein